MLFRRTLKILAILLVTVLVTMHIALHMGTSALINSLKTWLMERRISTTIDLHSSGFIFPNGGRWREMRLTGNLGGQERNKLPWDRIHINIDQAEIRVKDWRCLQLEVVGRSVLIELDAWTNKKTYDNFGIGSTTVYLDRFELTANLLPEEPLRSIEAQATYHFDQLTSLLKNGTSNIAINTSGSIHFNLDGQIATIHLKCVVEAGRTRLYVDRTDLVRIGDMMDEGLTPSELDLLEAYPARALKILMMQRYATNKARIAHDHDLRVPEDAYRHVLWSYLLTKNFGAEFANIVLSAHETGVNKKLNSESERLMDLNNNSIGIKIALEGLPEAALLNQVMSRRDIVKSANPDGSSNSGAP